MTDQNIKTMQTIYDAWNTGYLALFDEAFAPEVKYHLPPLPDMDLAGLKQYAAGIHLGMPDFKVWEEEYTDAGETSVVRYSTSSTHTRETPVLPGPPTGKSATVMGAAIYRWQDGKAVEVWHFHDFLGAFQQMGIIPPLG